MQFSSLFFNVCRDLKKDLKGKDKENDMVKKKDREKYFVFCALSLSCLSHFFAMCRLSLSCISHSFTMYLNFFILFPSLSLFLNLFHSSLFSFSYFHFFSVSHSLAVFNLFIFFSFSIILSLLFYALTFI